eukprot:scaffold28451_cov19-Tisochrysis_lutea.AAC.1
MAHLLSDDGGFKCSIHGVAWRSCTALYLSVTSHTAEYPTWIECEEELSGLFGLGGQGVTKIASRRLE